MLQSTSIIPQFLILSKNQQLPHNEFQLHIHVYTQKQLTSKQHSYQISQKHLNNLIKNKKQYQKYFIGHRKMILTQKITRKFIIEQSCIVQFSKQIQKLPDFIGIASQLLLSGYKFSRKSQKSSEKLLICIKTQEQDQKQYFTSTIIPLIKAKLQSKQWSNTRGNIQGTPQYFAQIIQNMHKKYNNFTTTIIKGNKLLDQGFRLLHAVGRGSNHQPIFINLSYNGNKRSNKWIAFIGKGVCFDAGGLDIKTPQSMKIMYNDKQGAASVLATFELIVKQKLQINVTCSIGLVENVISSKSYHPGDIIKSRKGLTVKIQDTDAQGRLVLADCMHWTQQHYNIQSLIQLSTLTYSNIAALGHKYTGLFTNSSQISQILLQLGQITHQYVWRMPVDQQHHELIQSQQADCINDLVVGVPGGSIAAAFLEKFVENGVKWVHLDIGGTGIIDGKGTGWGVILLFEYVKTVGQQA